MIFFSGCQKGQLSVEIGILKAIRHSSLNTSCLGKEIAYIVFEKLTQAVILNTDKHNARHYNCLYVKRK